MKNRSEASAAPADATCARATVLIVDDSEVARETLRFFVNAQPGLCVAEVVASATAALDYLSRFAVDLVLTDLDMPGISGFELTSRIKALPCPPHVVVISAQDGMECQRGASEAGAEAFITKTELGILLRPLVTRLFTVPPAQSCPAVLLRP